ncbi:L,D-transpeptidase, partial [Klebsiella pneumoniae]
MRNRFPVTLWLTLVALVAALALPARANTWPLPPPGSRLVGQNQFHVVQDD